MNETARECVAKAKANLETAIRESKVEQSANYDAVCFHAQQAAEKYTKALILENGSTPARTHDLAELSRTLEALPVGWSWPPTELHYLTAAAVEFPYPGETADRVEAGRCLHIAVAVGEQVAIILATSR